MQPVIYPVSKEKLLAELTDDKFIRRTNKADNEIYAFNAFNAPNLMREVGRLRELTFRTAGGGTGKESDIDEWDIDPQHPYQQLIVWDPNEQEILGGYRYTLCDNLPLDANGQPNLATTELFHLSPAFTRDYLPRMIELGRSFVQPMYQSTRINRQLARLAKRHHLAMATGSMSIIFKDPAAKASFTCLREENPTGLLFANLGAGANLAQAQAAVDLIKADALEIHLNAAQETVMPEGDRAFLWRDHLCEIITHLPVPVIIKEVGFGMTSQSIQELAELGATIVNVAGRGGTNFAMIEDRRNHEESFADLYDFGLTTPESLLEARRVAASTRPTILASGGITSPLDVMKSLALGAKAAGVAGYFLHYLLRQGETGLDQELSHWTRELKRLYALLGIQTTADAGQIETVWDSNLTNFWRQRTSQRKSES